MSDTASTASSDSENPTLMTVEAILLPRVVKVSCKWCKLLWLLAKQRLPILVKLIDSWYVYNNPGVLGRLLGDSHEADRFFQPRLIFRRRSSILPGDTSISFMVQLTKRNSEPVLPRQPTFCFVRCAAPAIMRVVNDRGQYTYIAYDVGDPDSDLD